jgi:ATP phosphoribosyltransferase
MNDEARIQLALPKGHMYAAVEQLLAEAGLAVQGNGRNYRPHCADDRFELKILKPQNIVRMVEIGSHDAAFAGHDWVVELGADVRELLDTGLDPVRLVAAAPRELAGDPDFFRRRLLVASEYEAITRAYLDRRNAEYLFVRSFGATEVFPPEDADLIVDNTASGRTLRENGLDIVDELLQSSTRLIANPAALGGPKGRTIAELAMLVRAVLDARGRVMLEMNVAADRLPAVLAVLPCMRKPTMSCLSDEAGFAVKAAVPRGQVARLIPELKAAGAADILEYPFSKVVL